MQQVLFGWTGLRLTPKGLAARFPPLLPSSVRRLVIRGAHTRAGLRDIVVKGDGLRFTAPGPSR